MTRTSGSILRMDKAPDQAFFNARMAEGKPFELALVKFLSDKGHDAKLLEYNKREHFKGDLTVNGDTVDAKNVINSVRFGGVYIELLGLEDSKSAGTDFWCFLAYSKEHKEFRVYRAACQDLNEIIESLPHRYHEHSGAKRRTSHGLEDNPGASIDVDIFATHKAVTCLGRFNEYIKVFSVPYDKSVRL